MNLARMSVHSASGSIPGIIDTNGTYVEHPQLRQRLAPLVFAVIDLNVRSP